MPRLLALIVPSERPLMASAKGVQTIDLGGPLRVTDRVDENILGDALQAIFAAESVSPQHPERLVSIERILGAYNLDQLIKTEDITLMLDRFAAQLDNSSGRNDAGRDTVSEREQPRSTNARLHRPLIETSKGAVLIDHKSFLGRKADWPAKALSCSGQLAVYRNARPTPAIESTWIHFMAGGGLVQVECYYRFDE
jgi:ATP-dependent helicase/nuclease subunit A